MNTSKNDIDHYIADFPLEIQRLLEQVRNIIKKAAPEATETINYGIPTFKLNGNLVHFAAFKKHIGLYPGSYGIENFKEALSDYKSAKGSVQFPFDKPIPLDLITTIVQFRVKENTVKEQKRHKKNSQE